MNTETEKIMLDDMGMTPFLKRVTLFSSGGPFLDGFILAIISVVLVQLTPELNLAPEQSAAIGASALVGIFVGALVGGYVTDLIGRKKMFLIDIFAIAAISIATMFVNSAETLVAMRFLIGIVIGADYPIATSLVAEFTPSKYRAISMGVLAAMWYVGATVAGVVGYLCMNFVGGWRVMIGSSVLFCLIILVGRMDIPESPRWLERKGRHAEASAIVLRLFGANVQLEHEDAVKTKISTLFKKSYFKRVFMVGMIWLCQIVPMFAVYTFGPQIMESFGLSHGNEAILGDLVISLFYLLGCIPAMFLLNKLGRRPMLIGSFTLMTLSLGILAAFPSGPVLFVVVVFMLYALFAGGPGIMQWLYPNELFPTDIRASAVGAAMCISRIGSVLTTFALPIFMASYGIGPVCLVGAGISLLGLVVSITMAPETKGQSLLESSRID